MYDRWKPGMGTALLVLACYILLVGAARYNLTASADAEASLPVTVVLDAGHGGFDGGAVSCSGEKESVINLQIAARVEQMLALCGIRTQMIRRDDSATAPTKTEDLKNRVLAADGAVNGLLVSIHQNHFADSRYSGAQVFYGPVDGSKALAQALQDALRDGLDPANDRQIKPADSVYLLQKIQCTGALVECGFLSNAEEEYRLRQGNYQTKVACAICAGIGAYLEGERNLEV